MASLVPLASSPEGRRRLRLTSPIDGSDLGILEVAGPEDVVAAVARARRAAPSWGARAPSDRAAVLRRAARTLADEHEHVIATIVRETARTPSEVLADEIMAGCDFLTYHAKHAASRLADQRRRVHLLGPLKRLTVIHRPLGVVGVLAPASHAFIAVLQPTLEALVAGNAVVLKASAHAPGAARCIADLFARAGLPEGALVVLDGDDETGAELVRSGVDMVVGMGRAQTASDVAAACGRALVPCTFLGGGKSFLIVCRDANLTRTVGGALFGAFLEAGQMLAATECVYVVDEVADAFVAQAVERTRRLRQGVGADDDVGGLVSDERLARVEAQLADAVAKGARVLVGGKRNARLGGTFFEPTVLDGVSPDMAIAHEKTPGPVLAIQRVRDESEAARLANDPRHAIGGAVWSRDRSRAETLARTIRTAAVCINEWPAIGGIVEAPFGGLAPSGLGQLEGELGVRRFARATPILVDVPGRDDEEAWYPLAGTARVTRRILRWVWGTPLGRWLA